MSQQNYVDILIESLEKKKVLLEKLQRENDTQKELLTEETFNDEAFDKTIDQKAEYIKELQLMDMGFEAVYMRVKETLISKKAEYAAEIKRMQTLIAEVTELSMSIQASEKRNDVALQNRFRMERSRIAQNRTSVKAVTGYYKNAGGYSTQNNAQYMDWKQ